MEPDLTQLSPAALDEWLGECERSTLFNRLDARIPALIRLARSLLQFKTYVHRRLDEAGVPADPESPHKARGCRIGGRLDIVLGAMASENPEATKSGEHSHSNDDSQFFQREYIEAPLPKEIEDGSLSLLMEACRHIRNTNDITPHTWAAMGGSLLAHIREKYPAEYDVHVRGPLPNKVQLVTVDDLEAVIRRGWGQHPVAQAILERVKCMVAARIG